MFASKSQTLPPSLPANWPNSTPEDIAAKPQRIVNLTTPQQFSFRSNFVKTSKYEWYNFLAKFCLEEFNPRTKVANCYFLLISALQTIPAISNTMGIPTTLLPLTIVLIIDAIFQIIEDLARHRADREANASLALRYNSEIHAYQHCKWHELQVGDYVKVLSRETIPADIVILGVAEKGSVPQGMCYVETKSLDGETNLKLRTAMPKTLDKVNDRTQFENSLQGQIEMEHPNKLIDSFVGTINYSSLGKEPIQPTNLLLRGCVLRNTDWAVGVVVNTGHDTKVMMSNTQTKAKTSHLEALVSKQIGRIITLLAVLCVWGAIGSVAWGNANNISNIWYLGYPDNNQVEQFVVQFFYYFLLHASFIPVSLYVTMAVVRFYQGYFMVNDLEIYYDKTDTPALVRTMTLNEELGQISHIFSDKTGTLTCNVMDFRKMSIAGESYGLGITEIGRASWKLQGKEIPIAMLEAEEYSRATAVPHVSFYDSKYTQHHSQPSHRPKLNEFFRFLAICHDVLPERIEGIGIKLSPSNPDDEALIAASKYFGYEFLDRREKFALISNKNAGVVEEVEILMTIPFTSKRKRMTVIARDAPSKENPNPSIKIYTKGADTVMFERFASGQDILINTTSMHLNGYSSEGLRCLLLGSIEISNEKYYDWETRYLAATSDINEINKKKNGQSNNIETLEDEIEGRGLRLIGVTAIEDKLQDGVPACIEELALAGISIWVLTGDKEETAINIAVACNLVKPKAYMDHIIINRSTTGGTVEGMRDLLRKEVERYQDEVVRNRHDHTRIRPRALIIDGPSLITAMSDTIPYLDGSTNFSGNVTKIGKKFPSWMENFEIMKLPSKQLLILLSMNCQAVIGCRVSPDQKREMVNLVKCNVPGVRTLAIGDGANDVAMIQEAHVGVGIRGEEGVQAVNSSDIAIAQFRYLSTILLKHGRYNYIRMSSVVCYMFYKNILMSTSQFWMNFFNAWSGQKYFTEGAIQLYNVLFTFLPIVLLGVYDMDISQAAVFKYPMLYQQCIENYYFTSAKFWRWIVDGLCESVWLSVLPLFLLTNSFPQTGQLSTFWEAGALCYTAVIIVANIKIYFIQCRVHWVNLLVSLASILLWFAVAFFISRTVVLDFNFHYVFDRCTSNGSFWLALLLLVATLLAKDTYFYGIERDFDYKPIHILQEIEHVTNKHAPLHSHDSFTPPGSINPVNKGEIELAVHRSV